MDQQSRPLELPPVPEMSRAEAEIAETRLLRAAGMFRMLLLEFHERKGWKALRFESWDAWATARLAISRDRAYDHLAAATIERSLVGDHLQMPVIPTDQLLPMRRLKDDPAAVRETWDRANEIAGERGEGWSYRHVRAAVDERTGNSAGVLEPQSRYVPIAEREAALPPAAMPAARLAPLMTSATPEWYTPNHIIERVLGMFEGIDLDPCSNSHEVPNVPAQAHYTQADDGLAQPWHGYVYMNPPMAMRSASGLTNWLTSTTLATFRWQSRWCRPASIPAGGSELHAFRCVLSVAGPSFRAQTIVLRFRRQWCTLAMTLRVSQLSLVRLVPFTFHRICRWCRRRGFARGTVGGRLPHHKHHHQHGQQNECGQQGIGQVVTVDQLPLPEGLQISHCVASECPSFGFASRMSRPSERRKNSRSSHAASCPGARMQTHCRGVGLYCQTWTPLPPVA